MPVSILAQADSSQTGLFLRLDDQAEFLALLCSVPPLGSTVATGVGAVSFG